jgi:hypothetical protein
VESCKFSLPLHAHYHLRWMMDVGGQRLWRTPSLNKLAVMFICCWFLHHVFQAFEDCIAGAARGFCQLFRSQSSVIYRRCVCTISPSGLWIGC